MPGPFTLYLGAVRDFFTGQQTWHGDDHYLCLLKSTYTPDSNHLTYSDISPHEATLPVALMGASTSRDGDETVCYGHDVSFGSSVTISARYLAIVRGIVGSRTPGDRLVGWGSFGDQDISVVLRPWTVKWDHNFGIFRFSDGCPCDGGGGRVSFPGVGSLLVAGLAPQALSGAGASPGVGQLLAEGLAPTTLAGTAGRPGVSGMLLSGIAPDARTGAGAAVGVGGMLVAGLAAGMSLGQSVGVSGPGGLRVGGVTPVSQAGVVASVAGRAGMEIGGFVPHASGGAGATVPGSEQILLVGHGPGLLSGVQLLVPSQAELLIEGINPEAVAISERLINNADLQFSLVIDLDSPLEYESFPSFGYGYSWFDTRDFSDGIYEDEVLPDYGTYGADSEPFDFTVSGGSLSSQSGTYGSASSAEPIVGGYTQWMVMSGFGSGLTYTNNFGIRNKTAVPGFQRTNLGTVSIASLTQVTMTPRISSPSATRQETITADGNGENVLIMRGGDGVDSLRANGVFYVTTVGSYDSQLIGCDWEISSPSGSFMIAFGFIGGRLTNQQMADLENWLRNHYFG